MYEAVFRVVHELVPQFESSQIIADFEEDLATAARAVFGNDLIVSGCWCHFEQALVKRMRKLGLVMPLRDDSGLQTLFQCLLSLPLLPVDDVRPGFEDVRLTLDDQSPSKSMMQQLLRYVEIPAMFVSRHRPGAVRSSAILRVVCQRSARPKPWLSALPHTHHNGAASVLTELTLSHNSTQFFFADVCATHMIITVAC